MPPYDDKCLTNGKEDLMEFDPIELLCEDYCLPKRGGSKKRPVKTKPTRLGYVPILPRREHPLDKQILGKIPDGHIPFKPGTSTNPLDVTANGHEMDKIDFLLWQVRNAITQKLSTPVDIPQLEKDVEVQVTEKRSDEEPVIQPPNASPPKIEAQLTDTQITTKPRIKKTKNTTISEPRGRKPLKHKDTDSNPMEKPRNRKGNNGPRKRAATISENTNVVVKDGKKQVKRSRSTNLTKVKRAKIICEKQNPSFEHPPDSAARIRIYEKRPLLSTCDPKSVTCRRTTFQYNYNWPSASIATMLRSNKCNPPLAVTFSKIAGLGAFATRFIPEGTPIIEYVGELCKQSQADAREAYYNTFPRLSSSCYLFRLDEEVIIDGTRYGNAGRFINHSCAPNCVAWKVLLPSWREGASNARSNGMQNMSSTSLMNTSNTQMIDASKSRIRINYRFYRKSRPAVVIFAATDINAGDELCYDYAFIPESDPTKRLKCYCGAKECRGWMA